MLIPKAIAGAVWALIFGLAIGLPFWWGFSQFHRSSEHTAAYSQGKPAEAKAQHTGTGDENTAANHGDNHGGKGQKEGRWYSTFVDHMPDWFVAIFTGMLTCVTVFLVRSTNRLWEAGERQLKLSTDTARRQLRAYPGVLGARIVLDGDRFTVRIDVRNLSTTPAYKFRHGIEYDFVEVPKPVQWKNIPFNNMQWDMAPHSTTTMRTAGSLGRGMTESLTIGDQVLVIWGRIAYEDAFGKSRYIEFIYQSSDFRREVVMHQFEAGHQQGRTTHVCDAPEPMHYSSN